MTNRQSRRRYRKSADRRVWVFSELNQDLEPEQLAKVLVSAGLERARLEQDARRQQLRNEEHDDARVDEAADEEVSDD